MLSDVVEPHSEVASVELPSQPRGEIMKFLSLEVQTLRSDINFNHRSKSRFRNHSRRRRSRSSRLCYYHRTFSNNARNCCNSRSGSKFDGAARQGDQIPSHLHHLRQISPEKFSHRQRGRPEHQLFHIGREAACKLGPRRDFPLVFIIADVTTPDIPICLQSTIFQLTAHLFLSQTISRRRKILRQQLREFSPQRQP